MGTTRVRVLCVRCHRRCHRELRLLSRTKPLVTAPTTGAESTLRTTRSDVVAEESTTAPSSSSQPAPRSTSRSNSPTLRRQSACAPCEAGRFQNASGAVDCWECEPGHYCLPGASAPLPCPAGTHQDLTLTSPMTSEGQCIECGAGVFCPTGAEAPTNCSAGTYNPVARQSECVKCEAGRFQEAEGATGCEACTKGHYCLLGSSTPLSCPGESPTQNASFAVAFH